MKHHADHPPVIDLIGMGLLDPAKLEDGRRGRGPYLEKVLHGKLTRLSRLPRSRRFPAHDLTLLPSATVYLRSARGPEQRLGFTETGDGKLEEAYARHFVRPGQGPLHPPCSGPESPRGRNMDRNDQDGQTEHQA